MLIAIFSFFNEGLDAFKNFRSFSEPTPSQVSIAADTSLTTQEPPLEEELSHEIKPSNSKKDWEMNPFLISGTQGELHIGLEILDDQSKKDRRLAAAIQEIVKSNNQAPTVTPAVFTKEALNQGVFDHFFDLNQSVIHKYDTQKHYHYLLLGRQRVNTSQTSDLIFRTRLYFDLAIIHVQEIGASELISIEATGVDGDEVRSLEIAKIDLLDQLHANELLSF